MSPTIEALMSKMSGMPLPGKAANMDALIQFHFSGAEAGDWIADLKGGQVTVSRGQHPAPQMTLSADSDDFLKLLAGELDPMQAFIQGRIKVAGDMSMALALVQIFNAR